MRIFERSQYICGYMFLLAQLLGIPEVSYLFFSAVLILFIVGYLKEGFRTIQLPYLLIVMLLGPLCIVDSSYLYKGLYLFFLGMSTYGLVYFGESDFALYPQLGPYKVGLKSIRTTKFDDEVWVFYPIDKDQYYTNIDKKNLYWLDRKNETHFLIGLQRLLNIGVKKVTKPHEFTYRQYKETKVDVAVNAALSRDF